MAIDASDFTLCDRMRMRQGELPLHLQMALQAGSRIATRIVNEVASLTLFRMQATWSMAGLAAILKTRFLVHDQTGMRRVVEIATKILMTKHAIFVSNKLGPRGLGNIKHRPVDGLTSYQTEQDGA
jgi:hypothetical protein